MQSSRQKIVQAAIALGADLGLEHAATAKIARQAQVATGTLFHHFKSKKDLVEEAYLTVQEEFAWQLVGLFDYPKKDVGKRIRKCFRTAVDYWLSHPHQFSFYCQVVESHYYSQELGSKTGYLFSRIEAGLELGIAQGVLRKGDPHLFRHWLFSTARSTAALINSTEKEAEKMGHRKEGQTFFWNGIRAQ